MIPKRAKPGLIVDLSAPANASVNDGIDRESCSITYITIDHVVDIIMKLGKGTLMAKAISNRAQSTYASNGVAKSSPTKYSRLAYGQRPSSSPWKKKGFTL